MASSHTHVERLGNVITTLSRLRYENGIWALHADGEDPLHKICELTKGIQDIVHDIRNILSEIELTEIHSIALLSLIQRTCETADAIGHDLEKQPQELRNQFDAENDPIVLPDTSKIESMALSLMSGWVLFQAGIVLNASSAVDMSSHDLVSQIASAQEYGVKVTASTEPDLSAPPIDVALHPPQSRHYMNPIIERWKDRADADNTVRLVGYFAYAASCGGNYPGDRFHTADFELNFMNNQITGVSNDVIGTTSVDGTISKDGTSVYFRLKYIVPAHVQHVEWECIGCITACGIFGEWRYPGNPVVDAIWRGFFGIWLLEHEAPFFEALLDELEVGKPLFPFALGTYPG